VSGTKSFGLDKTSLFSMGSGDGLMGSLSSSDSDNWGMVTNQNTGWDSAGSCKDGEADKGLHVVLLIVFLID